MKKRYNLFVAVCMVVGIVIGSGIFIKSQDILNYVNNNIVLGIFAWLIGGAIMIGCVLMFAKFAAKYSKINGIIDYAEAIVGPKYAYVFGSFLTYIYYPAMTSVLAWASARFTLELFNYYDATSMWTLLLSVGYLVFIYVFNIIAPKLSGKFQISTTIIKLIPIVLIAIGGTIVGLINGNMSESFEFSKQVTSNSSSIFSAIVACAFAYEGWIISTSINSELKKPKKNLPIALIVGCLIIIGMYILFFIGLVGAVSLKDYVELGMLERLSSLAAKALFGTVGGTLLKVFIIIACIGTLNGLMIANTRARYSIAIRNQGLGHNLFSKISKRFNMPMYSALFGFALSFGWLFYFFFGTLRNELGPFNFDSSELPIVSIYAFYIPLYIMHMKKELKENINLSNLKKAKIISLPLIATLCSLFMVFSAIYAHGIIPLINNANCPIAFYLFIFILIMLFAIIENKDYYNNYRYLNDNQ